MGLLPRYSQFPFQVAACQTVEPKPEMPVLSVSVDTPTMCPSVVPAHSTMVHLPTPAATRKVVLPTRMATSFVLDGSSLMGVHPIVRTTDTNAQVVAERINSTSLYKHIDEFQ